MTGRTLGALLLYFAAAARAAWIPNGTPTNEAVLEPVVMVSVSGGGCTGTKVGPNTILTAAHCFDRVAPSAPQIVVMEPRSGAVYFAREFVIHPRYDSTAIALIETVLQGVTCWDCLDAKAKAALVSVGKAYLDVQRYDLAAVKLPSQTAFGTHPLGGREIPLLDPAARLKPKDAITIVGYGDNDQTDATGSLLRRKGQNEIVVVGHGMAFFAGVTRDEPAGSPDKRQAGVGSGDSGGPVLVEGAVAAVNVCHSPPAELWSEVLENALGSAARQSVDAALARRPGLALDWAVTLSSPESISFLRQIETKGYLIGWSGSAGARTLPSGALKSPTLESLQRDGAAAFR